MSATQRHFILDFANSANRSIVLDSKQEGSHETRDRVWRRWKGFLTKAGLRGDTFLTSLSPDEQAIVLKSFLSCYRSAEWSNAGRVLGTRAKPLVASTVRDAAGHLAASFRIHHQPSPLHFSNSTVMHPFVRSLLSAFANLDPPKSRQKAITPKLLRAMYRLSHHPGDEDSPFAIVSELACAGFFYATRSCEITTTPQPGRTRIIQLDGITFWTQDGAIIAHDDPWLDTAYRVSVEFADQKNKTKKDSRSQMRTDDPVLCPVRQLASLIRRIHRTVPNWSGHTTINSLQNADSTECLTSPYLLRQIRYTCSFFGGRPTFGFDANEIGTKSIRSGAAMALFLMNHSADRIMIMGRWLSTAFLDYIRPQVLEWTNNMSSDMLRHDSFLDVASPPTGPASSTFNGSDLIMPRFHLRH